MNVVAQIFFGNGDTTAYGNSSLDVIPLHAWFDFQVIWLIVDGWHMPIFWRSVADLECHYLWWRRKEKSHWCHNPDFLGFSHTHCLEGRVHWDIYVLFLQSLNVRFVFALCRCSKIHYFRRNLSHLLSSQKKCSSWKVFFPSFPLQQSNKIFWGENVFLTSTEKNHLKLQLCRKSCEYSGEKNPLYLFPPSLYLVPTLLLEKYEKRIAEREKCRVAMLFLLCLTSLAGQICHRFNKQFQPSVSKQEFFKHLPR